MLNALRLLLTLVAFMVAASANLAYADPPDHAKAHGWRKKHDPAYVGYTGREWSQDFGVASGECRRKEIGTVVGAVIGGAVGSQIGEGSGRTVAIVVGSVLGAFIGREIGRDLDEGDRACVGHSLELARAGQSVRWINDATKMTYVLTPLAVRDVKPGCRKFKLDATHAGKTQRSERLACRNNEGVWTIRS